MMIIQYQRPLSRQCHSYITAPDERGHLTKMPCLRILTNVPRTKIPEDFCNKIVPVLVQTVKKSADKFLCVISGDCQVGFGGDSAEPGAVATLESIGHVGPEENKLIVKELSAFLQKEIGVSPDRFFISLYDVKGHNLGKRGTTLEYLQPAGK